MLAAYGLAVYKIVIATPIRDAIIMTLIPPNGTIPLQPKNLATPTLCLVATTNALS